MGPLVRLWVSLQLTLAPFSSTELFPVRQIVMNERTEDPVSWVLQKEKGRGPSLLGLREAG